MLRRNPSIIAGSRGGALSFERITIWNTILGIVFPGLIIVFARLTLCLIFFTLALVVGRQAGGLIAISIAVYVYLGVRLGERGTGGHLFCRVGRPSPPAQDDL